MGLFGFLNNEEENFNEYTVLKAHNLIYKCKRDGYICFKESIKFFFDKNPNAAIKKINEAITKDIENSLYYFCKGYIYEELANSEVDNRRFKEAIIEYKKSLTLNPNQFWVNFRIGLCFQHISQFAEAINYYGKVLKIDFNEYKDIVFNCYCNKYIIYHNRSICYANLKDNISCIEDSTMSISLNPNYANAYFVRGLEYIKLNNPKDAKSDLQKSKSLGYTKAEEALKNYFQEERYSITEVEIFSESEQAKEMAGGVRLRELFRKDLIIILQKKEPEFLEELQPLAAIFLTDMYYEFYKSTGKISDFHKAFLAYEVTKAITDIFKRSHINFEDFFKDILLRADELSKES